MNPTSYCKVIATFLALFVAAPFVQAAPQIVELTQVPCQFLESEHGVNQSSRTTKIQDCEVINDKTVNVRLANVITLKLKLGKTIFRVTHRPGLIYPRLKLSYCLKSSIAASSVVS